MRIDDSYDRLLSRTYYSLVHVQSAALFARLAFGLEAKHQSALDEDSTHDHRGFVTGAVFAAVAFLEANVNELCADTVEAAGGKLGVLSPDSMNRVAEMWKHGVPRTASYPIVEKYDILLALLDRDPMDKGRRPYQDAAILVRLRNYLMHYEPEWEQALLSPAEEEAKISKLARSLRGKFPDNPLTGSGNPFLPDRCLGHGCAAWAVTSAIGFADESYQRLEVEPRYEHLRRRLNVK